MLELSIAERNRAIKKTLESVFGRGKVTVRGSRGTGYGYVHVAVDWTPLDATAADEMEKQCKALLRAKGIDLGRAYTDDTCQHTADQMALRFNRSKYWRVMRNEDGTPRVTGGPQRAAIPLVQISDDITAALEKALSPARDRAGMFRLHSCSRCQDGAQACREGNPRSCGYPVARNH